MKPKVIVSDASIGQLCPQCGLCCDSTLFADVELRAGDDAARLRRAGLVIEAKGRTKQAFPQPCPCLKGGLCQIYAERPRRCRAFECGLLRRVVAREITPALALKKIQSAKRQADQVRDALRAMGQTDETVALTHRYSAAMASPMDLSDDTAAERHGQLMLAVNELMTVLQRDFLS
jgi:Fe-S-cluster containining protein